MPTFDEPVEIRTKQLGVPLLGGAISPSRVRVTFTGDNRGGHIAVANIRGEETVGINGEIGSCRVGGSGAYGAVALSNGVNQEVIHLRTEDADISVGAQGIHGNLRVRDAAGREAIHLQADGCNLVVGTHGTNGNIRLLNAAGQETIFLQADGCNLVVGTHGTNGNIRLLNAAGQETISLQAEAGNIQVDGDIELRNADCAEEFDAAANTCVEPGTVVAIDEDGHLRECREPYEKAVAGVIAGAGDYRPGIRLDSRNTGKKRIPVALLGKVYCKADAAFGAIHFGDLLTSSPTPGYAMKAIDPARAFGAVIGKALRSLMSGQDLIPILVALQ
jgi:hypothetical protein